MKDDTYDAIRAHLDRTPRGERTYSHGDFYRDVVLRTFERPENHFWPKPCIERT